jgi:hypothetical protein
MIATFTPRAVMGTAYDGSAHPTISIHVVGTDTINQVEIKKNSEVVQTIPVGSRNADLSWTDESFGPDDHAYYYVRVVQANNEEAISSPIWVD